MFAQTTRPRENPRRLCWVGTLALVLNANVLFGQRVSFGFIGGTNLTHDFPTTQDPSVPGSLTEIVRYSDHHGLITGISVEVDLGRSLSVEANALHRQLEVLQRAVFLDGTMQEGGGAEIGTWEWPILLKYRFPTVRAVRPFIEAGPSFRTRHNPVPAEPSQIGATIGTGIDVRFGRFRVSPAVRYTRWQYDGDFPRIATKRDQVEFLTGISYATSVPSWRLGNRKLRFGLIGGTPLTGGLQELRQTERLEEEQGYIGGLAVELELTHRLTIEVNGLYRPFRARTYSVVVLPGVPQFEAAFEFTVVTWQFPVLAKYRLLPSSKIQPVLEAGPSFRAAGNLNGYNPSHYGFTAGGGIETNYKTMKISPVLRYTRWANDSGGTISSARTGANQAELLVGFTF